MILKSVKEREGVHRNPIIKSTPSQKVLFSLNSLTFIILQEKCFSLCSNQIDQMTVCQIMVKTLIDLDLIPKDMKNSKRVLRSLRSTT